MQVKDKDLNLKSQAECEKISCDSSKFSQRFTKNLQELSDAKTTLNIFISLVVSLSVFMFDKLYVLIKDNNTALATLIFFAIFSLVLMLVAVDFMKVLQAFIKTLSPSKKLLGINRSVYGFIFALSLAILMPMFSNKIISVIACLLS